jgi:hypothetical protein
LGGRTEDGPLDDLTPREREVLGLPPSDADHRRVLAVLAFLQG